MLKKTFTSGDLNIDMGLRDEKSSLIKIQLSCFTIWTSDRHPY